MRSGGGGPLRAGFPRGKIEPRGQFILLKWQYEAELATNW
jgi:hypothetical protein